MKLDKYEDPTPEHGAEFMVGIADTSEFDKDDTLDKAITTLRNTGFAADQTYKIKELPVVGNVLFRIKNGAGKMFYYGGDFQITLNAKVIKFKLTHTYTPRAFKQAHEIKLKEMREREKAS